MKLCPKCQKHFSDDANFCPVDAARLVPLEAQTTGADSLTSRFELGQRLGGSRTGEVYRAVDKTTGKPCVVKLVSPAVVALPGVAQRLERELKQLERVKSVGVCQVLASGKRASGSGEETWVATEWLEGAQTLAEAIGARGPIPAEQAADLIEVVGEALIEAAQVGVVHRDLAPKNILFAAADVKLINFSLPVPTIDKVPGVPEFVAPEQVEGRPVDQRSNLYSLGALYYYVLTGQTPYAGSPEEIHRQHANGQIKPPSQLVSVPGPVETVIMRALDRSPTKRFLTVRQFVDEVTRVGHGEVIELKQSAPAPKPASRPKGELMQTLLGVKLGVPQSAPSAPPAGVSPVQHVAQAGIPVTAATQLGFQSGPPAMPAPMAPAPEPVHAPSPAVTQPGAGMAAAIAAGPVGMTPLTPPPGHDPQRSPWAAPGAAAAPAPAPAHAAAPQPAPQPVAIKPAPQPAPVPAAPVVAAPVVAQPASGKKKGGGEDSNKGKFRETMWFKKGDLDAQAAVAAAEERARTGKDAANDKADSKAIDERYNDDGSLSRQDAQKYSLRTGATQMMSAIPDKSKMSGSQTKVSEDELIGEMKGLPLWLKLAIPAGLVLLVLIIIFVAR